MIATALTDPKRLDLPFGSWTLDRLAAYLSEHQGIAIKRSRIDEILLKEGLRWRRHEHVVRGAGRSCVRGKRGGSRASTLPRLQAGVVVCLDEMGPESAKTFPGQTLVETSGLTAGRAKQEID